MDIWTYGSGGESTPRRLIRTRWGNEGSPIQGALQRLPIEHLPANMAVLVDGDFVLAIHTVQRRSFVFTTPRHRELAYATRPAQYDQHECKLAAPSDSRIDIRNEDPAYLQPHQVECVDCGALWTTRSDAKTRRVWVTRKVPRTILVDHPHPHWQGGPVEHTVWEEQRVSETVVTATHAWWFELPQPPRPAVSLSSDGRHWSDGRKWIPVAGIEIRPARRRRLRIGGSIRELESPPAVAGPNQPSPSVP
jgi:hypothetical protein